MLISFLGLGNIRKKFQDRVMVFVGARWLGSLYYFLNMCVCLKIFTIKALKKNKRTKKGLFSNLRQIKIKTFAISYTLC